MSDEALIQISRTSRSGGDEDEMQVEFVRGETHIRLGLSLKDFARVVTGEAKVPCKVRRWRVEK